MAGKEMELLVKLGAKIEQSYPAAVKKALSEAAKLQSEISKNNAIKGNAVKYEQMSQQAKGMAEAFNVAKANAAGLGAELSNQQNLVAKYKAQIDMAKAALSGMSRSANNPAYQAAKANIAQLTAAMVKAKAGIKETKEQYQSAVANVKKLEMAYSKHTGELKKLEAELEQAEFCTKNFANSFSMLENSLNGAETNYKRYQKLMELAVARQQQQEQKKAADKNLADKQQNLYNAYGNLESAKSMADSIMSPFMGAVKTAADFEQVMAKVKAITGSNTQEMARLEAQAKALGSSTQFSMTQAGEAMTYLGMAGWKTEQILGGMPGLLNLAAAAGADLAQTADIVSDGMTALGMTAGQKIPNAFGQMVDSTTHFADVMAAASSNANTNVQMMGETFKYAASTAGALGYSIDDLGLATGLMANAGIKGSNAGTALRSIFTRMSTETDSAAQAMKMLGINMTEVGADGQQKMKSFTKVIQEMRGAFKNIDASKLTDMVEAMSGSKMKNKDAMIDMLERIKKNGGALSEIDKVKFSNMLAGQEAMAGLLSLVMGSDEDFNKLFESIQKADGKSAEMAATMTNTYQGAVTAYESAVEGLSQSVGSVFLPVLTQVAKYGGAYVADITKWASEHETLVKAIGGVAAAAAGLVVAVAGVALAFAGWQFLTAQITAMKTAFAGLNIMAKMTTLAMAGISIPAIVGIIAVIAVLALLAAKWEYVKETAEIVWNHISGTISAQVERIKATFAGALDKITAVWNSVTGQTASSAGFLTGVINNVGFAIGVAFDIAAGMVGTSISVILNLIASVAQIIGGVVNIIVGIFTGDWKRAWDGAGQAVEGFSSGTLGTIKTIAEGVGSIFDTLMGKSDEVQRKAEAAQASLAGSQMSGADAMRGLRGEDIAGAQQAAAAAQQTAQATAEASVNAQQLAVNTQQAGAEAQTASTYMEQLQAVIQQTPQAAQTAFTGLGTQSAAAAQAVGMNFQQIPTQTQATFQQLPPMAQQGTDAMVQEFSQLATKSQPGGDAFVQAANGWGQQAHEAIANWSDQMAHVVVDKLSSAWAQISAQFSAGLNVNVTTTGGGNISHNAEGGIYRKGAFLTTFAENSAEAAIPLDGSGRAVSLWRQAGELLGILPKNTGDIQRTAQAAKDSAIPVPPIMDMVDALPPEISTIAEVISPPTEAEMAAAPVAYEPPSMGGDIEVNFNPQITIQGNADSGTVSQMGDMLSKLKAELMREVRREFGNMKADFEHQERRRSYAT